MMEVPATENIGTHLGGIIEDSWDLLGFFVFVFKLCH